MHFPANTFGKRSRLEAFLCRNLRYRSLRVLDNASIHVHHIQATVGSGVSIHWAKVDIG